MVIREQYLKQIRGFYDSDLIKIIVGVRRCGKSIILKQIMEEISKKSDNIIYLNFEDDKVISNIYNSEKLIDYIETNRKQGKCYVFLDEIQEVTNWNNAVKTLRLYDNSVFITGSNSKILSRELTDAISGRYVSFRIKPFVYKEIVCVYNSTIVNNNVLKRRYYEKQHKTQTAISNTAHRITCGSGNACVGTDDYLIYCRDSG